MNTYVQPQCTHCMHLQTGESAVRKQLLHPRKISSLIMENTMSSQLKDDVLEKTRRYTYMLHILRVSYMHILFAHIKSFCDKIFNFLEVSFLTSSIKINLTHDMTLVIDTQLDQSVLDIYLSISASLDNMS